MSSSEKSIFGTFRPVKASAHGQASQSSTLIKRQWVSGARALETYFVVARVIVRKSSSSSSNLHTVTGTQLDSNEPLLHSPLREIGEEIRSEICRRATRLQSYRSFALS